jgi:hypothetical protein
MLSLAHFRSQRRSLRSLIYLSQLQNSSGALDFPF